MKASVPFTFTEEDRQHVARFLGYERLASHIECVAWARQQLRVSLNVMAAAKVHGAPGKPTIVVGGCQLE